MKLITNIGGGIPFYDSNRPGELISPTLINPYSALTIPAYWRAINFLASNLSSFPRAVHQNGSPADATHPLNRILKRRPNAYQNPTKFWETFVAHAANYGNGYALIARDGITGTVNSLHNLMPHNIYPFRYDDGKGDGPKQYYYINTTKAVVAFEDVLHISTLSYDGMRGYDSVWMHRESLQRGVVVDKFITKYLMHGTVLRGAIEIPTAADEAKQEEIIAKLRRHFQGADSDRDVIVLTDGAKLNNATLTPQASQLMEQGAYTVKQISQITGVPPIHLFDFSEQKYNGTATAQIGEDTVKYCLRPWIEQIEDELTIKLLTDAEQDQGYEVKLDPNALIRGDTAAPTTNAIAKANAGIETPNEARLELGLPESDDPTAGKLKTLGDTTPQAARNPALTPPTQNARPPIAASQKFAAVKEHLKLSHFSDLIGDAAARVHNKTTKATEGAVKKFANDEQGWTAWANVFTSDQTHYAAVCVAPVLKTFSNLSGKSTDGMAGKAGSQYGRQLGQHLMALGKKQETTPPDLAAIIMQLGGDDGPEPESNEAE